MSSADDMQDAYTLWFLVLFPLARPLRFAERPLIYRTADRSMSADEQPGSCLPVSGVRPAGPVLFISGIPCTIHIKVDVRKNLDQLCPERSCDR